MLELKESEMEVENALKNDDNEPETKAEMAALRNRLLVALGEG